MVVALKVTIGRLLRMALAILLGCSFIIAPLFRLIIMSVMLVTPSVVLLDNHTTTRKEKVNPMAGSGKIRQLILGMDILLSILS